MTAKIPLELIDATPKHLIVLHDLDGQRVRPGHYRVHRLKGSKKTMVFDGNQEEVMNYLKSQTVGMENTAVEDTLPPRKKRVEGIDWRGMP